MRRRALFVTPPGFGHLFPMIPLAWAFRGAGHDVLIATCGISLNGAARAGLDAIDVAPGIDVAAIQERHKEYFGSTFPSQLPDAPSTSPSVFAALSDAMADGVVKVATDWRPDLIVYSPEAVAGPLAATLRSVPGIFFGIGLAYTPQVMEGRYRSQQHTYDRHGVTALAEPAAWLDLSPPSLKNMPSEAWPMRYVQYSGGTVRRPNADRRKRPCVAVTMGTVVPFAVGLKPLRSVIAAARDVDADFLVAHGSGNVKELGPLPSNVQAASWIGLDTLASCCTSAIHHAGFGTSLALLSAGLPQLLLPQGADQFHNASAVQQRGAGMIVDADTDLAAAIRRLLVDDELRNNARAVAAEMEQMPAPTEMVPRLIALAG